MERPSPFTALRASPLFDDVDDSALQALACTAQWLPVRHGQQVFAIGEPADHFYTIVSGEIQLYRPSFRGHDTLFQVLEAGALLAEAPIFLKPPLHPLTARASKKTQLYAYPREALLALCNTSPELMQTLLAALARRLYRAVNRIECLSLNNASQRLATYLLELHSPHDGHCVNGPVNINLPINITMLAGHLAMTPETLSRQLQKFRQQGLLRGKGRALTLLDPARLCEYVGLNASDFSGKTTPLTAGCCNLAPD